ncbi:MAG: HAD hydrolase-like protein [Actinobacteria bacterium]|nr:HAD hydrolase-like protein [Actinomycetota bacterium]
MEHAGLLEMFDHVLSVEDVLRYKPAPEPYLMAAERLRVQPSELRMVAAQRLGCIGGDEGRVCSGVRGANRRAPRARAATGRRGSGSLGRRGHAPRGRRAA